MQGLAIMELMEPLILQADDNVRVDGERVT